MLLRTTRMTTRMRAGRKRKNSQLTVASYEPLSANGCGDAATQRDIENVRPKIENRRKCGVKSVFMSCFGIRRRG